MSSISFESIWKMLLLHKNRFGDKGKTNHWLPNVREVFSEFYDKHQEILQKNQIYIIIQQKDISNKLGKKQQIKHKHQFPKYTCRYIISLLVRIS